MTKARSVSEIETELRGYEKCDRDRLDAIAEHLGFPVETLLQLVRDKDIDEDLLRDISEEIDLTASPTTVPEDTTVADLDKSFKSGFEFELTDHLSEEIFTELAQLTSNYSTHRGTKTVRFAKGKLIIDEAAAFPDSSKDTYKDNGEVAKNYALLNSAIIKHARENRRSTVIFNILAILHKTLTSLSDDACNQQNAADFAKVLQRFSPAKNIEAGRDTYWRTRVASEAIEARSATRSHP